jgi:HSP20 family protein
MDELWQGWSGRSASEAKDMMRPAMDVIENQGDITVRMDLPGLKPENVRVEIENDVLTISGEMGDTIEHEGDRYHYRERSYGSFQRSLRLPNTLDTENADASFENGVLTLVFPKQPQAQPKQIEVKTHANK